MLVMVAASTKLLSPNSRMPKHVILFTLIFGLLWNSSSNVHAQEVKSYQDVLRERSQKILQSIQWKEEATREHVLNILTAQYVGLNEIHEKMDLLFAATKDSLLSKEEVATKRASIATDRKLALDHLHASFLRQLSNLLSTEEIDAIKDGMTYRVCPITYTAFLDMIPSLKEEEKKQILDWLVAAREEAMDQGSSNKKHEVFGKYKGRINNYLSARGYDLKKEREDWQARIKERKQGSSE